MSYDDVAKVNIDIKYICNYFNIKYLIKIDNYGDFYCNHPIYREDFSSGVVLLGDDGIAYPSIIYHFLYFKEYLYD
jgi:hypothetical protein